MVWCPTLPSILQQGQVMRTVESQQAELQLLLQCCFTGCTDHGHTQDTKMSCTRWEWLLSLDPALRRQRQVSGQPGLQSQARTSRAPQRSPVLSRLKFSLQSPRLVYKPKAMLREMFTRNVLKGAMYGGTCL